MTVEELFDFTLVSERKLAHRLGVSEQAVRKWKSENAVPLDRIAAFAQALRVRVEDVPATTGVRGRPKTEEVGRAVWYCAVAGETYERRPDWCGGEHDGCEWRWLDA